jgi:hypothetical protein
MTGDDTTAPGQPQEPTTPGSRDAGPDEPNGAEEVDEASGAGVPDGSDEAAWAHATVLASTTRWRHAAQAQVLPLDTATTGVDGQPTGVFRPVPIVHPPGWCDHLDTLCPVCLPAWIEDHAIAVFRHGLEGATAGCRCPVCRTTLPLTDPTAGVAGSGPAANDHGAGSGRGLATSQLSGESNAPGPDGGPDASGERGGRDEIGGVG